MARQTRAINEGWQYTQIGGGEVVKDGEWLAVKQFPTTVHVELLKEKKIPDPVRPLLQPFTFVHSWSRLLHNL